MNPERQEFYAIAPDVWDHFGLDTANRAHAVREFRGRPARVLEAYRSIWRTLDVARQRLHRPAQPGRTGAKP